MRASKWYDQKQSQPYGLAGFMNDYSSRMVGYATLRQLRVKNGKLKTCFSQKKVCQTEINQNKLEKCKWNFKTKIVILIK